MGFMPPTFLTAEWIQADLNFKADIFPEDLLASVIAPRLDQLQEAGSASNWWFMRKPPGCRIRLHEADSSRVQQVLEGLTDEGAIAGWKPAIYEPETTAFGGPAGMDAAHTLFCDDTRGFLGYLTGDAQHIERRDVSLLLISTMLTAAGLDWFERGDVFARIAALRPGAAPDDVAQRELTRQLGLLLADTASGTADAFTANGPAGFAASWRDGFDAAGRRFAEASNQGKLHRGLRTILAQLVIFHWNRLGFKAAAQRLVAHAMTDMHLPRV
jgi:thiopeptide-type bacteriocin biosynthesis protein